MILQHIYTRERRGVFRTTEGYDTIAASSLLAGDSIRELIHPYCSYSGSYLTGGGVAPPAFTYVRYASGGSLLGRAVHVERDFSGQRSAFFMHNYILPPGVEVELGEVGTVKFLDEYNVDDGGDLAELLELPVAGVRRKKGLDELGISVENFAEIMAFLIEALLGAKKVYVVLPDISEVDENFSLDLIELIRSRLPSAGRKLLGFRSFSAQAVELKGVQLVLMPCIPQVRGHFVAELEKKPRNLGFFARYIYDRIYTGQNESLGNDAFLQIAQFNDADSYLRVPSVIVSEGKNSETPWAFVELELLQKVAARLVGGDVANLRYLLGNYRLTAAMFAQICDKLRRVYKAYIKPPHYEDIVFLFRVPPSGKLDEAALAAFAVKNMEFFDWLIELKYLKRNL